MRPYNFSAGPAILPETVLEQVQRELMDWQQCGMSVMEMSHRGKQFVQIASEAEQNLRQLLNVPDNYRVLFLQGGATSQFTTVPLAFANNQPVDYVNSGMWAKKAIKAAQNVTDQVRVIGEVYATEQGRQLPDFDQWQRHDDAAYRHYTPNETIEGLAWSAVPSFEDGIPLVADMSSCILSTPLDVSAFGLIYAGAQKNIGPAGLTLVIVADEWLTNQKDTNLPDTLNYHKQAAKDSMLNTPPTFTWYIAGLVFRWLLDQGGLDAMAQRNQRKASLLYQAIDESDFYHSPIAKPYRSLMNVPFTMAVDDLDKTFVSEAAEAGLLNLSGHRSVGGMRASLYNAMPEQGVVTLIDFMNDFARRYG